MALSKATQFRGITVEGAYLTVDRPLISSDKQRIGFTLLVRVQAGDEPIHGDSYQCPYDLDGPNDFIQAYTYLKTLPEFAEAIDC